jgi:hypothetical protein
MDPLSLSMIIGAGASLVSGIAGSLSAGAAANTQSKAAKQALDFQKKAYNTAQANAKPWLTAGKSALASYMGELGLSKEAKAGTFKSGFTTTPSYEFTRSEGQRGITSNLRALGLGGSGAALKALDRFNQNLAGSTYDNYLNRIAGVAGEGGSTAQSSGNQAISSAVGMGNAANDIGAATASGYVGGANAISGALGNFANGAGTALGNYDSSWNRIAA